MRCRARSHSSSTTLWICLYGLENSFAIHGFTSTWPCLIPAFLATRAKLNHLVKLLRSTAPSPFTAALRPSLIVYGDGVAPSPTSRCSSYWKGSLLVALDYGHQLYLLYNTSHVHVCGFKKTHGMNQCTTCKRINYHNTTNYSGYLT